MTRENSSKLYKHKAYNENGVVRDGLSLLALTQAGMLGPLS